MSEPQMTMERLEAFADAWGRGDVDELMTYMTEDCVYSASVGPEPGETFTGAEEVRRGFSELLAHDSAGESRAGRAGWPETWAPPNGPTPFRTGAR